MTTGTLQGGGLEDPREMSRRWSGVDRTSKLDLTPHPYWITQYYAERSKSDIIIPGSSTIQSQVYMYAPPHLVPVDSNQILEALGRVSSKIREHDFNAAVFSAELPQAVTQIISSMRAIQKMVVYAKKGQWDKAVRALALTPGQRSELGRNKLITGDVSGALLAIRYGWEPLIGDAFEAAKAIEKRTKGPRNLTFRASRHVAQRFVDVAPVEYGSYEQTSINTRFARYIVTIPEDISLARSLGLMDPASVLWEKMPWSFVLDWFLPIGAYLGEVGFWRGLPATYVLTTFTKTVSKVTKPSNGLVVWPPWGPQPMVVGGHHNETSLSMDRSVGSSISVPYPDLNDLNQAFSLKHLQNASALIHQLHTGGLTAKVVKMVRT